MPEDTTSTTTAQTASNPALAVPDVTPAPTPSSDSSPSDSESPTPAIETPDAAPAATTTLSAGDVLSDAPAADAASSADPIVSGADSAQAAAPAVDPATSSSPSTGADSASEVPAADPLAPTVTSTDSSPSASTGSMLTDSAASTSTATNVDSTLPDASAPDSTASTASEVDSPADLTVPTDGSPVANDLPAVHPQTGQPIVDDGLGEDSGKIAGKDDAPTPSTDSAPGIVASAQDGMVSATVPVDQHPAPSDLPAVHPATQAPLVNDGTGEDSGKVADTSVTTSSASAASDAAAPVAVEIPVADAAPTAANVPDVYTKLTADGAKLADDLNELAQDAGAVLASDLKGVANLAAQINETLALVLEHGGRNAKKNQVIQDLLQTFQQVEDVVSPLIAKEGDAAAAADASSLADKAKAALSGIEDVVLGIFKKLRG